MFDKFKRRTYRLEDIDTGNYTPEEYEDCISELQLVNRWIGDAHSLKATLFPEIEAQRLNNFSMLDVGAGSGELLRVAAVWARQTGRRLRAVGLELNKRSAAAINEESTRFPEISSVRGDALRLPFWDSEFDYVICSLFTHHFVEEQVIQILHEMSRVARRRIFVIDLHRHPLAYFLYTTLGKLVLKNRLVRHDGALSATVSTVDGVDSPFGQVAAAYALVEQIAGGAGQYGAADSGDGVLPQFRAPAAKK